MQPGLPEFRTQPRVPPQPQPFSPMAGLAESWLQNELTLLTSQGGEGSLIVEAVGLARPGAMLDWMAGVARP
jgi:hypothetical protein